MKRLWRSIKYSGVGVACAGVLSSITGFVLDQDSLAALLLLLMLLLGGCAATLTVDGTGSGVVVGDGNNINCTISNGFASGVCETIVRDGSIQTLTATPASGFSFDSWVNCSNPTSSVCTHTITADTTITANFVRLFTLTITINDPDNTGGRVTSNKGGIDCPGVCEASFAIGTSVQLTALGESFDNWTNCSITADSMITVTLSSDVTCGAEYETGPN